MYKKIKAFSLIELMVSAVAIALVAALTLPTFLSGNDAKKLYASFTKGYDTVTKAFEVSLMKNGSMITWNGPGIGGHEEYLYRFFKITGVCSGGDTIVGDGSDCPSDITGLAGGNSNIINSGNIESAATLVDGSTVGVLSWDDENSQMLIFFDTNGNRPPNRAGRDVFFLLAADDEISAFEDDMADCDVGSDVTKTIGEITLPVGFSCAARLLDEGKMNY